MGSLKNELLQGPTASPLGPGFGRDDDVHDGGVDPEVAVGAAVGADDELNEEMMLLGTTPFDNTPSFGMR
jgi:hypothetical protein